MYDIRITDYLTDEEKFIRNKVFVEEQGFVDEFDEIDDNSYHIVIYDKDKPIACCRCYTLEDKTEYILGRFAVIKEYRRKHIGTELLKAAEKIAKDNNAVKMSLSAQCRAKEFYKSCGFIEMGEIYYDQYCEHIHMEKSLAD